MWDENKARSFEELRKRKDRLTDAESTELAILTTKLDGIETAIMDEDTKRKMEQIGESSSERLCEPQPKIESWQIVAVFAAAGFLIGLLSGAVSGYFSEFRSLLFGLIGGIILGVLGFFVGTLIGSLIMITAFVAREYKRSRQS